MEATAQVRRFNRLVTDRVGALRDAYLGRGRSLGASRLLWEIGEQGADLRELRARLALDSGYLSRLLRSLEAEGLVRVAPSEHDRRVRVAALTRKGLAERRLLDRRSDALAESILRPLSPQQRQRLVAAMAEVERLLTASMVEVAPVDPAHEHARYCLRRYYAELGERFERGFDADAVLPVTDDEARPPHGLFLLARLRGEPVGCGALLLHGREPAEVKRMWVDPAVRGLGLGRRLLVELEQRARERGAPALRLETNRALTEAIALYRSHGFRRVHPFNAEPHATHWFEKRLAAAG